MTAFRPLLESSPNPRTRELLRAALGERPSHRATERTAAALGVTVGFSSSTAGAAVFGGGVATAGSGAAVASGSSALGAFVMGKWFAVGALSGTLFAGGSALVQRGLGEASGEAATHDAHRATAHGAALVTNARSERETNAESSREPGAPPGVASGTGRPADALDSLGRSPPSQTSVEGAASPNTGERGSEPSGQLTLELEPIDRARAALTAGNAQQALAELSRYERIRVTGTLDREARILRLDAMLLLGRRSEARELARGYLARFPKDAHTARLRELAGGT